MKGFSLLGLAPDLLMGKNPKEALEDNLRTAALTAGIVGTGGALAGAAPAAGAAAAPSYAAGAFGTAGGFGGANAAAAGLPAAASGGGLLGSVSGYAQPAMQAMGAANMAKGLLAEQPQQHGQPQQINGQGAQTLAQLAQQPMSPEDQARMQAMMQRKQMWG